MGCHPEAVDEHDAGFLGRSHCDYLIRRLIPVDKREGETIIFNQADPGQGYTRLLGLDVKSMKRCQDLGRQSRVFYRPQITSIFPVVNRYLSQKGQACGLYVHGH